MRQTGLQVAIAPNARANAQYIEAHGSGNFCAGFLDLVAQRTLSVFANQAWNQENRTDHLVMDSTDLNVFGEGEWLQEKHKTKAKRRSWRKLHLGLDLTSGEIICSKLTLDSIGDTTALPRLLDQIDVPVSHFLADGACDGIPTNTLFRVRFGETVEIIIPPPKNATLSLQPTFNPTPRDQHKAEIQTRGRMAWQASSGYNQRVRIEAQMGGRKTVIRPKLKARRFENQQTEAKIGVAILNKMTELEHPLVKQIT